MGFLFVYLIKSNYCSLALESLLRRKLGGRQPNELPHPPHHYIRPNSPLLELAPSLSCSQIYAIPFFCIFEFFIYMIHQPNYTIYKELTCNVYFTLLVCLWHCTEKKKQTETCQIT